MIDFSITKDPVWISHRENVWNSLEEDFKEGLRRGELNDLKVYFFTGSVPNGRSYPDLALFNWFPIQSPEGWDYVFHNLVKKKESFEEIFYFSFESLSHRAFNKSQELALWDYFVGNSFEKVIASKVAIGGSRVAFEVDTIKVVSTIVRNISAWLNDECYGEKPKWIERSDYLVSLLSHVEDSVFSETSPQRVRRKGRLIEKGLMEAIFCFEPDGKLSESGVCCRMIFLRHLREKLDVIFMQPLMRKKWEEIKSKYGA